MLPAPDGFDYGALGHMGSAEDSGRGQIEQEGDIRGHKTHIFLSSQFSPQLDLFMLTPHPFFFMYPRLRYNTI